jgi:hypothetical protein
MQTSKALGSVIKTLCLDLWPTTLVKNTKKFMAQFQGDFRLMLKGMPLVRFDGLYLLKATYWKRGESYDSEYYPIHEVVNYRYVRFLRDGTTMSCYTAQTPKKIFEKMKVHLSGTGEVQT